MIILKNTTKDQDLFLIKSSASMADEPTGCKLTTIDVDITENGDTTVVPPSGYDGLSEVNISVDVPDNYDEGYEDGVAEQKSKLTSLSVTTNGTYEREDGYNEVVVAVPSDINNQDKQVTYTENGTNTITADQGYSGLGSVEVTVNVDTVTPYNNGYAAGESAQKAKLSTTTLTSNDTYTREDGWNEVTVNVDTVTPYNNGYADGEADQKARLTDATFVENGQYSVENGYRQVTVNVNPQLQNKDVNPSTSLQTIIADSPNYGLGTVTVNPVTSSIDQNIQAGNIKSGISILGVNGSYDPQPSLQDKTVNPSTSQQVISADSGYDGLDEVTITAVTSAIDNNITSSNIKSGVTILGVTGDYDPQPDLETKSVTYTVNDTYTITPTQGKDGLSSVEVTVNVPTSGTNVPDWSSIGFTNSDVQPIVDSVDYSAGVKAQYIDNNQVIPEAIWGSMAYWPSGKYQKYNQNPVGNKNASIMKDIVWYWQRGSWTNTSLFYGMSSLQRINSVGFVDTNNTAIKPQVLRECFTGCASLTEAPAIDTSEATDVIRMFSGCEALTKINGTLDLSSATSMQEMFARCWLLESFPVTNTSGVTSLYSCFQATGATNYPLFDTSSVTDVQNMFAQAHYKVSTIHPAAHIPAYDFSSVTNVAYMFSNSAFWYNDADTQVTFDGFINLGKSFTGTNSSYHTLDLSSIGRSHSGQAGVIVLPKQSIMNIINALAAPDDTTCNDATLKLESKYYNLLDASDIAIATAKRWSVVAG